MGPPAEGETAPDFTLPDDEGTPFRLSAAWAESNVVLYFYPKDFTPGCIAESQEFRDEAEAFLGLDAVIVGISTGTVRSKAAFKRKYGLNFRLLADTEKEVCKLYGTLGLLGVTPKRVTFVIAKGGRIVEVFSSPLPGGHIEAARKALFLLREQAQPAASG